MNGTIWFRADHELIGRVIAEKLRRRFEQRGVGDAIRHDERAQTREMARREAGARRVG